MGENDRNGPIWKLFVSNPEIQHMLKKIRFESTAANNWRDLEKPDPASFFFSLRPVDLGTAES